MRFSRSRQLSSVWKGTAALAGGVMGGQILSFIALPFISRLYSAEEFGVLALAMSLTAVLAPVVSLRLESALLLPVERSRAASLFYIATASTTILSALSAIGVQLALSTGLISGQEYQTLPIWVAVLTLLTAGFTLVGQLAMRQREYNAVAARSLVQSVATNGGQIGFGLLGLGTLGLLGGAVVGRAVGIAPLVFANRKQLVRTTGAECRSVLREYWRFPTLFTASGLLNSFGLQAPILLAGVWFDSAALGQLGMAERILSIPVALVGGAAAGVLEAELAEKLRSRSTGVRGLFLRMSTALLVLGVLMSAGVILFASWIIPLVLGAGWQDVPTLMALMVIPVAARLVAAPTSRVLLTLQKGAITLALDVLRVVLVLVAAVVVQVRALDLFLAAALLYAALGLTYVVTWILSYSVVRRL